MSDDVCIPGNASLIHCISLNSILKESVVLFYRSFILFVLHTQESVYMIHPFMFLVFLLK